MLKGFSDCCSSSPLPKRERERERERAREEGRNFRDFGMGLCGKRLERNEKGDAAMMGKREKKIKT